MPPGLTQLQQGAGSRPRIVVADDSCDLQDLIALMLRLQGFDVVVAADGDAALAAILSEGADGLVSDFHMPGLDGLTLCRVVRALRAYAALPIVVFTGVGDNDPALLPLRGFDVLRVLHKPMGLSEIAPALIEMMPTDMLGRALSKTNLLARHETAVMAPETLRIG